MHRRTLHLTAITTTFRCFAAPCRRLELRALSTSTTSDPSPHASGQRKRDKRFKFGGRGKRHLSPELQMRRDTFKLIKKATEKRDINGWSGINKRRSEEMRLRADIRAAEWKVGALGGRHTGKLVGEEKPEMGHGRAVQLPSL